MDILYIVMPAYNEESNIERTVNDWYPVIEKHNASGRSRLLIIDDGSTDGTKEILESLSETRPMLAVVRKKNGGHGPAVIYGYKYALSSGADYIFQTDSDGQTDAGEFEFFWKHRKRYSMIIGRRASRGDGLKRKLVSSVLRQVLLISFRTYIPDANTPYRIMESSCLRKQLKYIGDDEKLPNIMLAAVYLKKKLPVLYRNITFKKRQGGSNTINIKKIAGLGASAAGRFVALDKHLSKEIINKKNR